MNAAGIISRLELARHPEGGWYREVHRSPRMLPPLAGYGGERCTLTAIYFLLEAGDFSAFHRVASEEAWIHLGGAPLELVTLGTGDGVRLLARVEDGGMPMAVVASNVLQASRSTGPWSLAACLVAPGFDFADFAMPSRDELLREFPAEAELVRRFTRER